MNTTITVAEQAFPERSARTAIVRLSVVFGASLLLILATRLPLLPDHLFSFDSVNLALALEDFDPARHQPQPPGYPLFVAEGRVINYFLKDPEATLNTLKVLVGAAALTSLYVLGTAMFTPTVGLCAMVLLIVNPVFWFAGLTSALRLHLALFSVLTAYLCWKSINGQTRHFYTASLVLGVSGGFRPDLAVLLMPLWLFTAVKIRRPRVLASCVLILLGSALLWLGILAVIYHGAGRMFRLWADYYYVQTDDSSIFSNGLSAPWRHMAGRAVIWTGLGSLGWIWAVPFLKGDRRMLILATKKWAFLLFWFLFPFSFHFFIHIGDPDHALSTIPFVCLVGALLIIEAARTFQQRFRTNLIAVYGGLFCAAVINMILFLSPFPLPEPAAEAKLKGSPSLMNALRVGVYETSYSKIREVEFRTAFTIKQLERLIRESERPVAIIWTRRGRPVWRKVAYYLRTQPLYVLDRAKDPAVAVSKARLWVGNRVQAEYGSSATIPFLRGSRFIWLSGSRTLDELRSELPIEYAPPIYYSDLPQGIDRFRIGPFDFLSR